MPFIVTYTKGIDHAKQKKEHQLTQMDFISTLVFQSEYRIQPTHWQLPGKVLNLGTCYGKSSKCCGGIQHSHPEGTIKLNFYWIILKMTNGRIVRSLTRFRRNHLFLSHGINHSAKLIPRLICSVGKHRAHCVIPESGICIQRLAFPLDNTK